MIPSIDVNEFLGLTTTPILDVRSPGEFLQGHIPAAKNTPLFSDEERAEVGTLYQQSSQAAAIRRGTEIAVAKSNHLLNFVRAHVPDGSEFVIHCWRGGMRSHGFARLCVEHGMKPRLLLGGYKAYRQTVVGSFLRPLPLVIITGVTGCGKTELLKQLQLAGEQIIDLESLANHKGSAFGGICQPAQPTVEQFENLIFDTCQSLRTDKPIWVEDESRSIGRVLLPEAFWNHFANSPTVKMTTDNVTRVDRLLREYGQLPCEDLLAAISRLRKRLGGQRFQDATRLVQNGNISQAIELLLEYYDKAYAKALAARPGLQVCSMPLEIPMDNKSTQQLRELGARLIGPAREQ